MWFPINTSTLNMGSDTSVDKYPTHPCHIVTNERLDKIRSQFECDFKKFNIQLPINLQTWGKLYDDSGFEVIYSLGVDPNNTPYLNYASHHRIAGSSSAYLLENGDSDAFDFDEEEDALMRLCGIADNWEYNDVVKPQEPFNHFWENSSPFSQWHKCSFHALGVQFNSAEQYMMLMKALLHNDIESAEKIMATSDVRKQKEFGRQVKNFNNNLWFANCRRLVYEANKYKFTQNYHLLSALLDTGNQYLVEASPYDTIWGIGLAADDPRAHDSKQWLGKNWLGEILTLLREDIKYCIEKSPEWEKEEIADKPLNDWQYQSLIKGYKPDWDFRYAPRSIDRWHYITRSGYFVKKFRYELQEDGLYHIAEHYTSKEEKGRCLLQEMLQNGYFKPAISEYNI